MPAFLLGYVQSLSVSTPLGHAHPLPVSSPLHSPFGMFHSSVVQRSVQRRASEASLKVKLTLGTPPPSTSHYLQVSLTCFQSHTTPLTCLSPKQAPSHPVCSAHEHIPRVCHISRSQTSTHKANEKIRQQPKPLAKALWALLSQSLKKDDRAQWGAPEVPASREAEA